MTGQHKGLKLDTNRWRAVTPMSATEIHNRKSQLPNQQRRLHWVKNINVAGKYYDAAIPLQPIDVQFVVERFDAVVPAAHSMTRFKFAQDNPVYLFDHLGKLQERRLTELYLSPEAARPAGVPFDLYRGMRGDFILVNAFYDVDYIVRERLSARPDIQLINMKLNTAQKAQTLAASLKKSRTDGYRVLYNTLNENNCHGANLVILDEVMGNGYTRSTRIIKTVDFVSEIYPVLAERAIKTRDLYVSTVLMKDDAYIKTAVERTKDLGPINDPSKIEK